ncbi:hypothetical protein [Sphingomonas sp. CFBP 13720]|uniref:hypothetical protein n=1 Tax=Sphingomonas sp. CFBP 13720 TaxID=2775302 RepID=UPI00177F876D|nr:hypothetical protein [Sphingomonas sp. CFBP 13720]MBD8678897.1 hypothetical protein [Sphingomonas sp. CFBP 13720]
MTVRARAWTGIVVPPLTWFLFEQGLSALLHADCRRWWAGILWGIASAAICAAALRRVWPLRRDVGDQADFWLARLAPMIAGLFTLAILFQTLAVLLVPSCVR